MSSTAVRFNRGYNALVSSLRNSFLFIVFFNLLVFFPSLGHYFFSDDWWSIAAGKYGLDQLAPDDASRLLFRPLFHGIFYGEYFLFNDNAFLWHALGLLFHFLALFLLLKLLRKIASPKIAFFLTLNFSCLTLNTHTVAWASANGYILFSAAVTGLVYALIAYAEMPRTKYLVWAFCCAAAACFLYENGVIVAALSAFYLRRTLKNSGKGFSWKREGLIIAPVFLYLVGYLIFNLHNLVLAGPQLWVTQGVHPPRLFLISIITTPILLFWWALGLLLPSTIVWLLPAKVWRLVFTISLRHISAGMALNFFVTLVLLSAFLLAVSRARARQYRFLVIFLGLLTCFYAFIIACGRGAADGFAYVFSHNAYYSYIFSGYLTLAAACLIDPMRCSAGIKKALVPFAAIFILLNAFYSFKVNYYMYEESRLFLQYKKYMADFIAKHRSEPDFSLRVDNDIVIFYTTPPLPLAEVICDKRYLTKLKPKYLLDLKELDFYKEWQRSAAKPLKAWYRC